MAAPSEELGYTERSVSSIPVALGNPTGHEDCIMGSHVEDANIAVTNVDEVIRFFSTAIPDIRVGHDYGHGPRMRQAMQSKVSISRDFKRAHFTESFTAVTGMLARSAALCLALLSAPALTHAAIASLNLANYTYTTTVALNNSASNEVSGITWNWDTNTLFMVGDEAQAIAQYSLNGTYIDSMAMTGFSNSDAEGITYIGSGQFVIAMETNFDAKLVDYVAGGTANGGAGGIPTVSIFSGTDRTYGFEGISYDPSTVAYFFLEEKGSRTVGNSNPGSIYYTTLNFSPPSAIADPNGTSIVNTTDISGIQALSTVMIPGSADYSNLLIVSHEGHLVMEVGWSGNVLSSFSLSGAPDFQSEGVTIDGNGVIYVVDEGPTSGSFGGASCSGQNCPLLHIFSPDADGAPGNLVDLSGTIKTTSGQNICAMVLASGKYTFSCNPPGVFSLTDLPREDDGTVKRQIYANGFFPKLDVLPDSVSETVVMTRAGSCPSYNVPYNAGAFPDSAGKRINITGKVLLQNTQTPICAMVLANGQYMFSCDGTGSYALNIPLDTNGQFKLQVYADGFAPTNQTYDEFQAINDVRMARAVECQ